MTQITRAALLAVAAFTGTVVAAVADVPPEGCAGRTERPSCCDAAAPDAWAQSMGAADDAVLSMAEER